MCHKLWRIDDLIDVHSSVLHTLDLRAHTRLPNANRVVLILTDESKANALKSNRQMRPI